MAIKQPDQRFPRFTHKKSAARNQRRRSRRSVNVRRTVRGVESGRRGPFLAPEDWYEPSDEVDSSYRIVVQEPGPGLRHVVTAHEVEERLAKLPAWMLQPLEIVQLSRVTRKKSRFPLYGMQWGNALYLYPLPDTLIETFVRPPLPSQLTEAAMYGGHWREGIEGQWQLVWTEQAAKDYFLNNILIHELGHLLDNRNRSFVDRERYAEWFAIEYGYLPERQQQQSKRRVVRRHHSKT